MDDTRTTNRNTNPITSNYYISNYVRNDKISNNSFLSKIALNKYLCNTIEESIKSIDNAMKIKDYDNIIINR